MNPTNIASPPVPAVRLSDRATGPLLALNWIAAVLLCLRAAYDVATSPGAFPDWFPPLFAAAVLGLCALAGWMVMQAVTQTIQDRPARLAGLLGHALWALLPISFLAVTSLHRFLPFRDFGVFGSPDWAGFLQVNFALAVAGLVATLALWGLWASGPRGPALALLLGFGLVLLVPNDDCRNAFNRWWIGWAGASPLMYVPNLFAILFVTSGLRGVHPRLNGLLAAGACLGALFLGLGHQGRLIW